MHTFISEMFDTCANEIQNKPYIRKMYPYVYALYLWSFLVIVLLGIIAFRTT
jgi:hypothetical protein